MPEILEIIKPSPVVLEISETVNSFVELTARGLQGVKGDTGLTGATGPSGVVSVTAPITNTGTSTAAVIGVDQSQFVIAQSQVTDLVSSLSGKANLTGGNTFAGVNVFSPTGTTGNALVARAASAQSASTPVFIVQNFATAVTAFIDHLGGAKFNNGVQSGSASFSGVTYSGVSNPSGVTTLPSFVVKAVASQTANLQEWQNSAGGLVGSVTAGGGMSLSGRVSFGTDASARFNVSPQVATQIGVVVRGAASQTASLTEWQNSAASIVARVNSDGSARFSNSLQLNSGSVVLQDTGVIAVTKRTSSPGNPGANTARLYFRDGTNAGTLKLCVIAGAAGAETTILDNIPQ